MLTSRDFRRIALGLKDAVEGAHMGHPDFRLNGRIVHADLASGMVKLTPDQQSDYVKASPAVFTPENGAWGREGCTAVRLALVDEDTLGEALTLAWGNIIERHPTRRARSRRASRRTSRPR